MKGYKYLSEGMRGPIIPSFEYELDKWHKVEDDDKLCICSYGFHYFKDLSDLLIFMYRTWQMRVYDIYEVEAAGKIMSSSSGKFDKYCSSEIRIVREIPREEIERYMITNGIAYNSDSRLRIAAANYGLCLDSLINDEDDYVRAAVAKHKFGLDVLINDEDWYVRAVVAEQGYGLDVLINDKNWSVRMVVAHQGYGLDKLVYDSEWQVRKAVAEQGYGLNILVRDNDPQVRYIAKKKLSEQQGIEIGDRIYTLSDMIELIN